MWELLEIKSNINSSLKSFSDAEAKLKEAQKQTEDLDNNAVLSGSGQEAEPAEQETQEPAEEPVEIDNDEEPNEQPVVSEV